MKYDILTQNNAQEIMPVPSQAPPTPIVPHGDNYGQAENPMPLAPPSTRKNDNAQYCNFIQPSPRSQDINVPYQGKQCPDFGTVPFNSDDACYLVNNNAQGVVGIACNSAGGNNGDSVRGKFGWAYPIDMANKMNEKQLNYVVKPPVQLDMEKQNPMIIYDKNTFYPENDFAMRKNKNYITYPLQPNYTSNGLPTYQYPDVIMNQNVLNKESHFVENFTNNENNEWSYQQILNRLHNYKNRTYFHFFIFILFVIIIFYFIYKLSI